MKQFITFIFSLLLFASCQGTKQSQAETSQSADAFNIVEVNENLPKLVLEEFETINMPKLNADRKALNLRTKEGREVAKAIDSLLSKKTDAFAKDDAAKMIIDYYKSKADTMKVLSYLILQGRLECPATCGIEGIEWDVKNAYQKALIYEHFGFDHLALESVLPLVFEEEIMRSRAWHSNELSLKLLKKCYSNKDLKAEVKEMFKTFYHFKGDAPDDLYVKFMGVYISPFLFVKKANHKDVQAELKNSWLVKQIKALD